MFGKCDELADPTDLFATISQILHSIGFSADAALLVALIVSVDHMFDLSD